MHPKNPENLASQEFAADLVSMAGDRPDDQSGAACAAAPIISPWK
jgi:hypothetical protein